MKSLVFLIFILLLMIVAYAEHHHTENTGDKFSSRVQSLTESSTDHINYELSVLSSNDWSPDLATIKVINVSAWEGSDKFCVVIDNVLTPEESQQLIELSERKGYTQATINIGGKQVLITEARNNDRCVYEDPQLVEQMWQRVLRATAMHNKEVHHSLLHVPWINKPSNQRNKKSFQAVGLNERMRYLRYDPGTYFAPHYDGSYQRPESEIEAGGVGEKSFVTFQLYLNQEFEGGTTRFLHPDEEDSEETDVVDSGTGHSCSGASSGSSGDSTSGSSTGHSGSSSDSNKSDVQVDNTGSSWFNFFTHTNTNNVNNANKLHVPRVYNVFPRTGSVLLFQHDCLHEGAPVRAGRKYAVRTDVMYSVHDVEL